MKKQRRLYVVDYILTPETRINNGGILCDGDKILAVGGISAFSRESGMEIYTFENAYATPGFIDSHIHGAGGFDCSSVKSSPRSLADMSRLVAERGVTSFVPTVVAAEREEMLLNLSDLADMLDESLPGADGCAINIEGPFINPAKCGSQVAEAIVPIDLGFARELIAAGNGKVKLMTFAPELDRAIELVEYLRSVDVEPSMGHSLADEAATVRAVDAGARRCTHLFNGMPPLHQREMNLTSIALTDRRVMVEMILDGRHINPRMVDLACRCKVAHNVIGISDCTMAAGMPDGNYHIGPARTHVENGYSRSGSGALAGTTAMLDSGWRSLMGYGHVPDVQAARAVSWNPARSLGLEDRGRLMPRLRADIAIFEKNTDRPLMTVRRGQVVFKAEAGAAISEVD